MFLSFICYNKLKSITLVAQKSSWCLWGGGSTFRFISLQNKDEPLLKRPIWKKQRIKPMYKKKKMNNG